MKALTVAFLGIVFLAPPINGESTSDMLERVLPGVVTIAQYKANTLVVEDERGGRRMLPIAKVRAADPYKKVLDLSGALSAGSGFIIEHEGQKYVVTNAHVVEAAADDRGAVVAFTGDREKYDMRLVGADTFYDVAVLAFAAKRPGADVTALKFKASEIRVGERVFAIGNPFARYPFSVSDGIVGGKNRQGGIAPFGYLQSTATISSGNSGGPLVDLAGDVVGINTSGSIQTIGDQIIMPPQLNFALESTIARRVVGDLLANDGRVRRAYFGLRIVQDLGLAQTSEGWALEPGAEGPPTIASVVANAPAADALEGKAGAQIVRIGQTTVESLQDVLAVLEEVRPGSTVAFTIKHQGKTTTVEVVAGEMDDKCLADLGTHLLDTIGFRVREENRGLSIESAKGPVTEDRPGQTGQEGRINIKTLSYGDRKQGFRSEPTAPQGRHFILAVGNVDERGEGKLWQVSNMKELGLACRLAAMNGQISIAYVSGNGRDFEVMKCLMSQSPNVLTTVLLF